MTVIRDAGYRNDLAHLTPTLRRFARALVPDHSVEVADDLVQATLVSALAAGQERRASRLPLALLTTLVGLNRARAHEATADRVSVRSGASQTGSGRGSHWNPPQPSHASDGAALGTMPLECRETLLLVVLEKLTYTQVAEVLGVSLNAVMARLSRAREHLARTSAVSISAPRIAAAVTRPREPVAYLRVVK